jgi:hypothetical protein
MKTAPLYLVAIDRLNDSRSEWVPVTNPDDARRAVDALVTKGAKMEVDGPDDLGVWLVELTPRLIAKLGSDQELSLEDDEFLISVDSPE